MLCMSQSLKAIDFEYTDEVRWSSYFDTQIRNFAQKAKALKQFRGELVKKCDGQSFDELQERWDYSQVLLGGVDSNGEYREQSLAKLYKELFGLRFKNFKDAVEKKRQAISLSTEVVVDDTAFSTFIADTYDKAKKALQQAHETDIIYSSDVDSDHDYYDILSDQDNLIQLLTDFMSRLQGFLPNYSQKGLFIWTLNKTTNRYLSIAYPKIKDRQSWEWLDRTFGLEPVFVPDIDETGENVEEKEQQYTVYGYREGSLGDSLTDLYQLVWDAFAGKVRSSLQMVFPKIPNFKQEFLSEAYDKLDQIGWNRPTRTTWRFSDEEPFIRLVGNDEKYSGTRGNTEESKYRISGVTLDKHQYSMYNTSGNHRSGTDDCNFSLLRILDDLSPGLFLLNGLEYELHIDQDSLEIEKL